MSAASVEAVLSNARGLAYPTAQPIAGTTLRIMRRWIVRFREPYIAGRAPGLAADLTHFGRQNLATFYGAAISAEQLDISAPAVSIFPFDGRYAIVETQFAVPSVAFADSAMLCQIGVLTALDFEWPLEELQGLPLHRWFFFRHRHE